MRSRSTYEVPRKDRILLEFQKTCRQVGAAGLLDLKQDSALVHAVDLVLRHGLREPVQGYWSLVRSLTHSTTLKALEAFVKYISSSHQKGLAWTYYTLDEGSFEFYLSSLLQDTKVLHQHYMEPSLMRDLSLAQHVVTAISNLRAEAAAIQASMESSLMSDTPLDQLTLFSPSLTSPVDSGVALIDSDNSSTSDGEKNEEYPVRQSWKQEALVSSLGTETCTSSNHNTPNRDLNANPTNNEQTENKTKSIIAQNKLDSVCRRPKKKKKSEPGKRVSFHQDSNDDSESPETGRKSNMNKFFVEGRYSWAGEGDNILIKDAESFRLVKSEIYERKGLSSCINIFDSELAIEADCDSSTTTLDDTKNNIELVCEKLTNVVKNSLGLKTKDKAEGVLNINLLKNGLEGWCAMSEREAPEGQEDPELLQEDRLISTSKFDVRTSIDLMSDSEWSLDTIDKPIKYLAPKHSTPQPSSGMYNWPARVLNETPSKSSLVKRFLRSIPSKKPYKPKKQTPKASLYIKGVKPDPVLSQSLIQDLKEEIDNYKPTVFKEDDEIVTLDMENALMDTVLMNQNEKIYKVYRVASTEGVPLLAVLSDNALYMTGLNDDNSYSRRHHISYNTLDAVVIGPEYQTVMLVTVDHSVTVTVISALGQSLVTHMVTYLALAVWRATLSHLSVCVLSLSGMHALYRALLSQTSVTKDEQLHYYRYIRVEDSYQAGPWGPLGPTKSGHLMYRAHTHAPWLPGYIVLKGGILYVFSDVNHLRPKHVLSFHMGYFGGCRRVFNSKRPHTFEVLPFSQRGLYGTFQFAAADDYEASDWLQIFIQTSTALSSNGRPYEEPMVGCGLLLTSQHLLTLDFPDKVLNCARLQDISNIRTATTCCILETSCREVQESGGDWILYFLTEEAIAEFLEQIYLLRPELKQAVVESWECEALHSHCLRTSQLVCRAWDPLLRPLLSTPSPSSCDEHHFA